MDIERVGPDGLRRRMGAAEKLLLGRHVVAGFVGDDAERFVQPGRGGDHQHFGKDALAAIELMPSPVVVEAEHLAELAEPAVLRGVSLEICTNTVRDF